MTNDKQLRTLRLIDFGPESLVVIGIVLIVAFCANEFVVANNQQENEIVLVEVVDHFDSPWLEIHYQDGTEHAVKVSALVGALRYSDNVLTPEIVFSGGKFYGNPSDEQIDSAWARYKATKD